MKTTGFLLFENIHNKKDTASSRIRGKWLVKCWKEAEEFVYGKKYESVIFQKAYLPDYCKLFDGIKILDLCDPDWIQDVDFRQYLVDIDVVTVSTEELGKFISTITDKPVVVIPDRMDFEYFKEKKIHKGKAKEVCWFGYSHNSHVLKSLRMILPKYDLGISVISNEPIMLSNKDIGLVVKERYTKWDLKTVNREIIKSDFVVMPGSTSPNHRFKSDNKTTTSWALGMPVAVCEEDLKRFSDPLERQKEADLRLKQVKENNNVKTSVEEMKALIDKLKKYKEVMA